MANHAKIEPEQVKDRPSHARQTLSRAGFPLVALCGITVAACMYFGNPVLWMSQEQMDALPEFPPVGTPVEPGSEDVVTLSSYQAISQSENASRAENLKLATEAINGIVIQPGETFSFNDTLGPTTEDKGYRDAPVIMGSSVVDGEGGGICQVSTALYIAAIEADMEIVERHSHSIVSDYAPIGLDATVSYGDLDLKLKNNSDAPITIYASAKGQTVDVALAGAPLAPGRSIDATSRIVDRYEEKDAQGVSHQYYVSESFRVYFQDGVREYRDLLSSDIYLVEDSNNVKLIEGSVEPSK